MNIAIKSCLICGTTYSKKETTSWVEWGKSKYCSVECHRKSAIGKPSPKKGKHYLHTQGKNHYAWKGDNVGYFALHAWVRRTAGSPPHECAKCGTTEAKRYEWANISMEYKRDIADFRSLCKSCHTKESYERGENPLSSTVFKKGVTPWHAGTKGLIKAPNSAFKKGFTPWNKGKTLSEEHRRKLSESHKGHIPWNKKKDQLRSEPNSPL